MSKSVRGPVFILDKRQQNGQRVTDKRDAQDGTNSAKEVSRCGRGNSSDGACEGYEMALDDSAPMIVFL